jgi:hypothetical protein
LGIKCRGNIDGSIFIVEGIKKRKEMARKGE